METKATRTPLLYRLARWLLVSAGVLSILLAAALGLFRLLLGQVPEYQAEIKAWVAAELGVEVDFATLNARLSLAGPELSLSDASIGNGNGFLQADQASITLDPVALFGREFRVSRLTIDGVALTVERDAAGRYRLGEYVIEPGSGALIRSIPDSVTVRIRDSALRYVDTMRGRDWAFSELELEIESDGETLGAAGSLAAPPGLARRIDWSAWAQQPPDAAVASSWQLAASVADLELEALTNLVPVALTGPVAGRGDVFVEAEWSGGSLGRVFVESDFEALQIGPAADDNAPFSEFALQATWQGAGPGNWSLAIGDLRVERAGVAWPRPIDAGFSLETDRGEIRAVSVAADYLRIVDLEPFVRLWPESQLAEQWTLFEPEGELAGLDVTLELRDDDIAYDVDVQFEQLAFDRVAAMPGLGGLSGTIEATEDSGTIRFASQAWQMDWPALLPLVPGADSLTGTVVWRQWDDVLSLTSVNLSVGVQGHDAVVNFDLELPLDARPPTLELRADLEHADLVAARSYLPTPIMPPAVVGWLNRSITGGSARNIELTVSGALPSFPFDDGSGLFRVTADIDNASLDYSPGWPAATALNGEIEFLNAGFSARAAGSVLSNRSEAARIDIRDMRRPLLTLTAATTGPLTGVVDFLRDAPQIASALGPDFERITVNAGDGAVDARLDLPLLDPGSFSLDAILAVTDGELAVAGLKPVVSEINGTIVADEHSVTADALGAQFIGGPVTASLQASARTGYRAEIRVDGETTADAVARSFDLPHQDLLAGQARWRGTLLLPALDPLATTRAQVTVESNLSGVALRFPEPLAKAPGDPLNLRLDIGFVSDGLELRGNLGATRRFVLGLETSGDGISFASGTVRFGGEEPVLPINPGLLVDGQLEHLALDPWFDLAGTTPLGEAGPLFLGANLDIVDFHALGQRLGVTAIRVQRGADDWLIDLDSEAIAGSISVPRASASRGTIVADMQRVYLATDAEGDLGSFDPRTLPGIRFSAAEFGFGNRQFGRVEAAVETDPRGLRLTRFSGITDHYETELSGSWLQGALGTRTTIDARIVSTDVAAALAELGLDPVIAGESAELNANIYWDAAPGGAWLEHLNGDVDVLVETGTMREIDPGAGRMLGLMSIAALPRRLALDFRDVFGDGFAFDEIRGSFMLVDGNAYTDNLKLDGPAAEIGVVGRTGLRDQDYTQQVVVSTEPGNALPTVAGLLGGPGAGAAIFVFTRLFKKSFEMIGSVSYCITGSWEEPNVERIADDATDRAAGCAELPADMISEARDD